jgi:hypothetical protein
LREGTGPSKKLPANLMFTLTAISCTNNAIYSSVPAITPKFFAKLKD